METVELPLHLEVRIAGMLMFEAERRGLDTHDLARWVLGSWALGELTPALHLSLPILGAATRSQPIPEGNVDQEVDSPLDTFLKLQAAAGSLSCKSCTQKLGMTDVDAGACSKCEAPID